MKRITRLLSLLIVLTLILPGFAFGQSNNDLKVDETRTLERISESLKENADDENVKLEVDLEDYFQDDDEVRIIVELKSDPAIVYATERNIGYSEMSKSSLNSIEKAIDREQESLKTRILSKKVDMQFLNSFNTAFNGFSGKVKFEDINIIENLPGVNKVYISNEYERPEIMPNMDTSNDMIGALPTWDIGYKGEGTVVAIIDTGIDPSHRDMVLSQGINPKITRASLEGKDLLGKYYTEKVPYGYNYYDLNNTILDNGPGASMHGMHVAGTVGANGDVDNGGIKGVAPESQLLAMKVFSNDPIYATTFSDIYLVAIDESIRLGADVLNMSLGSTASFYIQESPEDIAITNATDNGIVASVSAGNSASITDGWTASNSGFPWKENPDIGVVGAPGLNKDTIQVASIENTHQKVNGLVYMKDNQEYKVPMAVAGDIDPAKVLPGPQEFVEAGDGSPEFLTDVEGKVVIVVRGGNTGPFTEKIENAQNAGAAAIIVRNHESGGEELINMASPDIQTIPAVFIGYSSGMKLLGLEDKTLTFTDELMKIPNVKAEQMSDFTSWGVTPSLELKPEITAPGGQIYSTLNNDRYGVMSGTSMAAPHVSGGSSLVMEYIKKHEIYGNLTLGEQTRLAKVLLMNTAEIVSGKSNILSDDEFVYSPRRQGAGLMNLYSAVSTPVRVVDANTNEAKVELKDFENTEITMSFRAINDSNNDASYNVDTLVLTDYIYSDALNLLSSDEIDALVSGPDTITVPANGEYTFDITIDIGTDSEIYRNMFVEGFVSLVDPEDNNPDISVPYLGFYGDWGEPSILDGMRFIDPEGESYFNASGMLHWTENGDGYYYDTPHIFMNPGTAPGYINGTGNIMPYLSFMRNSEAVDYNILDEDGNLLRTILKQQYMRKSYIDGGRGKPVRMIIDAEWDGMVNGNILQDGNYFYEINTKVHYEGAEVQSKRIPITIDTVGPEVSNLTYNPQERKLTWNAVDKGSGILGFMFDINGEEVEEVILGEEGKISYEFDMEPYIGDKGEYMVEMISVDKLENMSFDEITISVEQINPYIYILSPSLLDRYNTNEVLFEGYVANLPSLEKVIVSGVDADIEFQENVEILHPDDPSTIIYSGPAFKFTKIVTLEDGYHEARIEAISETGASSSLIRRFYVDTIAPELEISVLEINKTNKTAELEINMLDNLGHLSLYLGDSQIYLKDYPLVKEEPANETITHIVNLKEGNNSFEFTLKDGIGHSTTQVVEIVLDEEGLIEDGITNIKPSRDIEIESGDSVVISFNAPTGGKGYYKIILPLGSNGNKLNSNYYGTPMAEQDGLYSATWVSSEDLVVSNLQIEVTYVDEDDNRIDGVAEGKITVVGSIEDVPVNSIILGDEAFDMDYLNNSSYAQRKLIEWQNTGKTVYMKIGKATIVDINGNKVGSNPLPNRLTHKDIFGDVRVFQR